MKVKKSIYKFVSPGAAKELRIESAKGAGGAAALAPADRFTAIFILTHDKDPDVSALARTSFEAFPIGDLMSALEDGLDTRILKQAASVFKTHETVLAMIALHENTDDDTLAGIVAEAGENLLSAFTEDPSRLLGNPIILEALKKNHSTPKKLLDRLISPETGPGPKEDKKGAEAEKAAAKKKAEEDDSRLNISQKVANMSVSQKIKAAITGNKEVREVLIKSSNKLITASVLKNPMITENEIKRLTSTKGTSEDLLRQIARNKDWLKKYPILLTLVTNPKTPLNIAMTNLRRITDKDLAILAKSKNISSVLASSAKRTLEMKTKR